MMERVNRELRNVFPSTGCGFHSMTHCTLSLYLKTNILRSKQVLDGFKAGKSVQ